MRFVSKLKSASVCEGTKKENKGMCEGQRREADRLLVKIDDRIPG